ncbi:MAG: MFS transporter [Comamonadaceae bacterium]|nr:MFS transporter [Comamonadaceae bacterium]
MSTTTLSSAQPQSSTPINGLLNAPVPGWRRAIVVALCFVIVAIEGFDAAIIGFVAPQVAEQFGAMPGQISLAISAGMLGLLLGYLVGGPQADRRGRKPVLIVGIAIFGIATVATALSVTLTQLIAWRLVTGIGIGAAMPAMSALLAEILPATRRASTLSAVFCGFLFGSAAAGILTGQLIDTIGWHGLFVLGGIAPLVVLPLMLMLVPESPQFLLVSGETQEKVREALRKIGITSPSGTEITSVATGVQGEVGGLRALFGTNLRLTSMLIWGLMFLILGSFYVIASYLPTMLKASGVSLAMASKTSALFQTGGLLGAVVGAIVIRKLSPMKLVWIALLVGAVMPWILSAPAQSGLYNASIFVAGVLISGPIVVINAVIVMFYPTSVRSTGAGWANSMGRLGSFVCAGSIGWLVQQGISLQNVIASVSIAIFICAVLAFFLSRNVPTTRD